MVGLSSVVLLAQPASHVVRVNCMFMRGLRAGRVLMSRMIVPLSGRCCRM
jgi:hypothetical protein